MNGDHTDLEIQIALLKAKAKAEGCTCDMFQVTQADLLSDGGQWLPVYVREAVAKAGPDAIIFDHHPECLLTRINLACWN